MKKLLTIALFIYGLHSTFAQTVKHNDFYSTLILDKDKETNQIIQTESPITSIAIELPHYQSFTDITLNANGAQFFLSKDIHSDLNTSNLIIFSKPIQQFEIITTAKKDLKLHLLYAPPLSAQDKKWEAKAHRIEDVCEKSEVVAGTQWRIGLPVPKEPAVATQVRHVIIHHAAGSNTATNYTEVVRNIFLLHTQTNGWNDIGYNFLIAQDGTVFEGRQGQGGLEADNVLGAHFCGKNTNTMGICLLGNYQTVNPPQPMLNSLYKMIAWKLKKESLSNVFASFLHPQGTTSATMLGVIGGHRDGCSTDCPGDNVYRQLAQIRTQVTSVCNILSDNENTLEQTLKIYPQPTSEEAYIHSEHPLEMISVQDLTGKEIEVIAFQTFQKTQKVSFKYLKSGVYILKILQKGKIITKKLLLEK